LHNLGYDATFLWNTLQCVRQYVRSVIFSTKLLCTYACMY